MAKKMKPTDLRRLNAMFRDEADGEEEYLNMARELKNAGMVKYAQIFEQMANDERQHKANIKMFMLDIKEFGPKYIE